MANSTIVDFKIISDIFGHQSYKIYVQVYNGSRGHRNLKLYYEISFYACLTPQKMTKDFQSKSDMADVSQFIFRILLLYPYMTIVNGRLDLFASEQITLHYFLLIFLVWLLHFTISIVLISLRIISIIFYYFLKYYFLIQYPKYIYIVSYNKNDNYIYLTLILNCLQQ